MNIKEKVFNLAGMVEYQEGSLVSQTLVDKSEGTITLFAFDKDQNLSEHTTPYDAFVYIADGSADIIISNKVFHVRKGEFIIMPANKPHAVKAKSRFKMLLIMVKSKN